MTAGSRRPARRSSERGEDDLELVERLVGVDGHGVEVVVELALGEQLLERAVGVERPLRGCGGRAVSSSRSEAIRLSRRTVWPKSVVGVWFDGRAEVLQQRLRRRRAAASSRAEAEEKRAIPVLKASCVSGSRVLLSFSATFWRLAIAVLEVGLVGLDELVDSLQAVPRGPCRSWSRS